MLGTSLLANAYNELPNKEIHSISVGELAAKLGFKDKHSNQHYLKAALRALRSCEVEWNILGKDKEEWGVTGLLAEVRIADGICYYQFPHTLRLKLYNPRIYTKLNSTSSKPVYEPICPRFMGDLFRLFRYRPGSRRNAFHFTANI